MMIEERRCPRCGIRRTVRLGTLGSVCLNCRLPLDAQPTVDAQPTLETATPAVSLLFNPSELARLESYRNAIRAGLYTDWPAQAELV